MHVMDMGITRLLKSPIMQGFSVVAIQRLM